MRRPANLLLLCAVAGLGLAAAVDALRTEGSATPTETTSRTSTHSVEVEADELRGVLYYTDEACRLRGIELPELTPVSPRFEWNECGFSLAPHASQASTIGTTWDSSSGSWAFESERRIVLAGPDGVFRFLGSAPAFNHGGWLAFFRDGAVRGLDPTCVRPGPGGYAGRSRIDRCSRVLLRPSDLRQAVRRHPNIPDPRSPQPVRVKEAAWLDRERLAALLVLDLRPAGRYEAVAVLEGRQVVHMLPSLGVRFSRLRASSRGHYFGVRTENPRGVLLFDRDGRALTMPLLGATPHAFAWSPGETWTAVATRAGVYVFRTAKLPPRVRRLGITAADIAWR